MTIEHVDFYQGVFPKFFEWIWLQIQNPKGTQLDKNKPRELTKLPPHSLVPYQRLLISEAQFVSFKTSNCQLETWSIMLCPELKTTAEKSSIIQRSNVELFLKIDHQQDSNLLFSQTLSRFNACISWCLVWWQLIFTFIGKNKFWIWSPIFAHKVPKSCFCWWIT